MLTKDKGLKRLPPDQGHPSAGLFDSPVHRREMVTNYTHLYETEVKMEGDVVPGVSIGTALEVNREPRE